MSTTSDWWYKNRLSESASPPVIQEAEEKVDAHVVVIGKDNSENTFANIIGEICKAKKIPFNFIDVATAWIASTDVEIGSCTIALGDEKETSLDLSIENTIIFPRAGGCRDAHISINALSITRHWLLLGQ